MQVQVATSNGMGYLKDQIFQCLISLWIHTLSHITSILLEHSLCCSLFECRSLLDNGPGNAASYRLTSPLIGSCIVKSNDSEAHGIIEVLGTDFYHDSGIWDFM